MLKIITKIIVNKKSPQQILDWVLNLNQERYIQWHSAAHKNFRFIKKTENTANFVGSIIYFDEIFDEVRIKGKWEFIEAKNDLPTSWEVKMKAKTIYPVYLCLCAKKINSDTEITHMVLIGFSFQGLEKFFDWFVKKFIFTERKINALERHTTEEFKNLEKII